MEVTTKERGHRAVRDKVTRPTLRPVPLYYAIARHGQDGLRLLHVPLGFDEEALVAFLSWGEQPKGICFPRFSAGSGMLGNAPVANSSPYSSALIRALSGCC
jgi:hypothetical protein